MDRRVLFATPSFLAEGISVDYHVSMLSTVGEMMRHGVAWDSQIIAGNQFIDDARNLLVNHFLKSEAKFTDLFFIDADQGWDPKVVMRFLNRPEAVVCGLPPKRCDMPQYHSNALTGVIENGLFQAQEAGTGFMRIRRSVFERMDKAFPELRAMTAVPGEVSLDDQPKPKWALTPYFQGGNTKYGVIREDIFFCRQMVAMGEFLWIDPDVTFTHRGSKAWKGNFYDHCVRTGMLKQAEPAPIIKAA